MATYLVIDSATQTVLNVVLWDGETDWHPGKGCELVEMKDEAFVWDVGWKWDGTNVVKPTN